METTPRFAPTHAVIGRDVAGLTGLAEAFEAFNRVIAPTTEAFIVLVDHTGAAPTAPPRVVARRRAANRVARASRRANR